MGCASRGQKKAVKSDEMSASATGRADAEDPPVSVESQNVAVEELRDVFGAHMKMQQERDKDSTRRQRGRRINGRLFNISSLFFRKRYIRELHRLMFILLGFNIPLRIKGVSR